MVEVHKDPVLPVVKRRHMMGAVAEERLEAVGIHSGCTGNCCLVEPSAVTLEEEETGLHEGSNIRSRMPLGQLVPVETVEDKVSVQIYHHSYSPCPSLVLEKE